MFFLLFTIFLRAGREVGLLVVAGIKLLLASSIPKNLVPPKGKALIAYLIRLYLSSSFSL